MKTINFDTLFNREKFEVLFKLYFIIVISSWMLLGFLMVIDLIVSASFTDKICTYMAVINLILLMPLPIWIILRVLLYARQTSNQNKIFVTNSIADLSSKKSDEPKYTEKEIIAIVSGLIKNRNYPGESNLASAAFYASAINNNDGLSSSLRDNNHNWHTSASSSDSFSDRYTNPSSSYYHSYHSSSSSPASSIDHHNRYCNPSHPLYKAHHST